MLNSISRCRSVADSYSSSNCSIASNALCSYRWLLDHHLKASVRISHKSLFFSDIVSWIDRYRTDFDCLITFLMSPMLCRLAFKTKCRHQNSLLEWRSLINANCLLQESLRISIRRSDRSKSQSEISFASRSSRRAVRLLCRSFSWSLSCAISITRYEFDNNTICGTDYCIWQRSIIHEWK